MQKKMKFHNPAHTYLIISTSEGILWDLNVNDEIEWLEHASKRILQASFVDSVDQDESSKCFRFSSSFINSEILKRWKTVNNKVWIL